MKRVILAALVSLIAYSGLFDCKGGSDGSAPKPKPQISTITAELITSVDSEASLTGYKKWKTNFMDSGPYGEDFELEPGGSYRVAGFCVPKNRTVEGKIKGGMGWEFPLNMKPGDCKQLSNLDVARITVKEDKK